MRNRTLGLFMAALGLAGGTHAHASPSATLNASIASSKSAAIKMQPTRSQSIRSLIREGERLRCRGKLDNSPAKNRRIKRKNQRRAWASGNKKAFA